MKVSAETLQIIRDISHALAPHFKFDSYTVEDLVQEATIFAINALSYYEEGRGTINNFLFTHIKNRLSNLRRDRKSKIHTVSDIYPALVVTEYGPEQAAMKKEMLDFIDRNLSPFTRKDYIKYKDGIQLSSFRLLKLQEEIREILMRHYTEADIREILDV